MAKISFKSNFINMHALFWLSHRGDAPLEGRVIAVEKEQGTDGANFYLLELENGTIHRIAKDSVVEILDLEQVVEKVSEPQTATLIEFPGKLTVVQ